MLAAQQSDGAVPAHSVEEHLQDILRAITPLTPLEVVLDDALGCVLAEDVAAPADLPAFDNSQMDGYAVHSADVAGASAESPAVLRVVADLPAGATSPAHVPAGAAVRIMTGAPVPEEADAVVPVEWTDRGLASVRIDRPAAPGLYVRRAGSDLQAGDEVLGAGIRLAPRHIGLLAAFGRTRVVVQPRPRVVVLSTGTELVEPGRPLQFGQIWESNSHMLAAAVQDTGARAYLAGVVGDESAPFSQALEDQLVRADIVITTGGISEGAYDVVKEALAGRGVTFRRVAMQPGGPQGFGHVATPVGHREVPIFTLPGNPVSAYVSFEVFVRPALRKMMGYRGLFRPSVQARVAHGFDSVPGKRQFVRAVVSRNASGEYEMRPVGGHSSHLIGQLAQSNALAVVPEATVRVEAGDELSCLVIEQGRP